MDSKNDKKYSKDAFLIQENENDLEKGVQYVPKEVTDARKSNEKVFLRRPTIYLKDWFWEFPDQSKICYEI